MIVRNLGLPRLPSFTASVVGFTLLLAFALPNALAQQVPMSERDKQITKMYREEAWAHFRMKCKENAREVIANVVRNVDSVFLARPRVKAKESDLRDQFWAGDPYGYSNYEGLYPIATYLYDRSGKTITDIRFTPIRGYRFVEVENHAGAKAAKQPQLRYLRYALADVMIANSVTKKPERRREPVSSEVAELRSSYGITWEDISTQEDRKYWVAGGRLSVFEIKSGRVIAERVGYIIEPGFGSTNQGRRPWLAAGRLKEAFCPQFENYSHKNKEFVARVLIPASGADDGK